jgi:hypothetical protein
MCLRFRTLACVVLCLIALLVLTAICLDLPLVYIYHQVLLRLECFFFRGLHVYGSYDPNHPPRCCIYNNTSEQPALYKNK